MSRIVTSGAEIHTDGAFASAIADVCRREGCAKFVETGTHVGAGSTAVLVRCLPPLGSLVTMEICPSFAQQAADRWVNDGRIRVYQGLSVPRRLLPSAAEIRRGAEAAARAGVDLDVGVDACADFYASEVGYSGPDDLLGRVAAVSDCDFLMLDSAGHMGFVEFEYCVNVLGLRSGCVLALDDVKHMKHYRSWAAILADGRRWEVVAQGVERHGFGIAIRR